MDTVEFAAARHERLLAADKEMAVLVKEALTRYAVGDPNWREPIVTGAAVLWLEIFSREAPDAYPDSVMRDFQKLVNDSLDKTAQPVAEPTAMQISRVTNWIGTLSVNDATFHANRARGERRMTWVTMHDESVRDIHVVADGQQVSVNGTFTIDGYGLRYPGEPVGPPEVWINCRCLIAGGKVSKAMTAAAAEPAETESFEERSSAVIVALPAAADPITAASSEDIVHITLVWLGDSAELAVSVEDLKAELASWAAEVQGPLVEKVSGSAILGADEASVVLVDASALAQLRAGMIDATDDPGPIAAGHAGADQFPTWLPHVTLGYPETPALAEYAGTEITFDRFALWVGNDRTEFTFGETAMTAATETPDEISTPVEEPVDKTAGEIVDKATAEVAWHAVLAPMGVVSGDNRMFTEGGLTNRVLPLPLSYQVESDDGHKRSVVIGRIDEIWHEGNLALGRGVFRDTDLAKEVIEGIEGRFIRGVSVDLDKYTLAEITPEDEAAIMDGTFVMNFTTARIAGATGVAIPAFEEAYIALGADFAEGEVPPAALPPVEGEAIVASASVNIVAGAEPIYDADWFRNPGFTAPTPLQVTADGRIFGHVATWGTCHIGLPGACTTAPKSRSGYAYYKTGVVSTTAGDMAVGQITMDTGHAGLKAGSRAAAAHYDNTGSAVADVGAGEDTHGIWIAGAMRASASDEQRQALRAGALSGDWRMIAGNLEMVAALAVNVPGFPIPRVGLAASGEVQESLVASGIVEHHAPLQSVDFSLNAETVAAIVRTTVDEVAFRNRRQARLAESAAHKATMSNHRLARVRARLNSDSKGK